MTDYHSHVTVLKKEVVDFVTKNGDQAGLFGDFTFGGGGHSRAILETHTDNKLIGFDQDLDAINNAKENFSDLIDSSRLKLVHSNFINASSLCEEKFNGICMDLGVSNHQFSEASRGFSFRHDGPLDMRMNFSSEQVHPASYYVNNFSAEDLADIFYKYGEERFSKRIAERICEERESGTIDTTKQLENIVFHCYPRAMRFKKTHPATRVFQALRIFVNSELEVLDKAIADLFDLLLPGGRLAIISFHSIEDRIVKQNFVKLADRGKILTKKPRTPGKKELENNPKSRSAKLRVIEKNE